MIMNIQTTQFVQNSNIYFTNKNKKVSRNATKYKKHEVQNSPLQEGVKTAAAWFGFGVILDIISRKCRFFKSPTKNSIAVNSILGLGAGIVTTFKAFSSAGK